MPVSFVLKTLWRVLEPRRRVYFAGLVALLFVTGIFEMAGMMMIFGFIRGLTANPDTGVRSGTVAKILRPLFDGPMSDTEFALAGGGLVLGVMVFKNVQAMFARYHLSRFLSNLNHRVSTQLFAALMTLPYERMLSDGFRRPGETLRSTITVLSTCFGLAAQVLADGATLSMIVLLLLYVDPWLTAWSAVSFGGLGVLIYRTLQKLLRELGQQEVRISKETDFYLRDGFGGIVEARLQDNVRFFLSRFTVSLSQRNRIDRKQGVLRRIPRAANEILLSTAITGAVAYMTLSGLDLNEALPILGVFGFAGMRANGFMSRINSSSQTLRQKDEQFRARVDEVALYAPQVFGTDAKSTDVSYLAREKPLPAGRSGHLQKELALREVTFTYPDARKPAIRRISLTIPRGQFVSLCGESGGGKSTLLMLMMGLVRPTEGVVLCDGWDISEHIRAWHKNIGYVRQAAYISPGSVRENVAFGIPPEKINDDKVWRALELAAAREFVEALPRGLETRLREGGGRLSGGQRQRIVIARALYHDPEVVVFDEATAALDNITEREVTDAALRLRGNKTVVCVAHRLSTIRNSDVIHLVQKGEIIASGTYDELLQTSDTFQRMARAPEEAAVTS